MTQLWAVRGARRWHVLNGEGGTGCGRQAEATLGVRAHQVALADRCKAKGCEEAWPAPLRSVR